MHNSISHRIQFVLKLHPATPLEEPLSTYNCKSVLGERLSQLAKIGEFLKRGLA